MIYFKGFNPHMSGGGKRCPFRAGVLSPDEGHGGNKKPMF